MLKELSGDDLLVVSEGSSVGLIPLTRELLPGLADGPYEAVRLLDEHRIALEASYEVRDGAYLRQIRDILTAGDAAGSGLWTRYLMLRDIPDRTARERIQKAEGRYSKRPPADSAAEPLLSGEEGPVTVRKGQQTVEPRRQSGDVFDQLATLVTRPDLEKLAADSGTLCRVLDDCLDSVDRVKVICQALDEYVLQREPWERVSNG